MDRNTLLKPRELPRSVVNVPELGGNVYVRTMSVAERDEYEQDYLEAQEAAKKLGKKHIPNLRARLLVRTLCDAKGTPLLTPEDVEALGAQPIAVYQALYNEAANLNRLTKADQEELEKN